MLRPCRYLPCRMESIWDVFSQLEAYNKETICHNIFLSYAWKWKSLLLGQVVWESLIYFLQMICSFLVILWRTKPCALKKCWESSVLHEVWELLLRSKKLFVSLRTSVLNTRSISRIVGINSKGLGKFGEVLGCSLDSWKSY